MFMLFALSELITPLSIATARSVNAKGNYLSFPLSSRSQMVTLKKHCFVRFQIETLPGGLPGTWQYIS
jgi:hypothetical protein